MYISHRVVILVLHLFIASPSYRLFKDSEFGIMAEIVAGPFDCVVLQKMREMHQNAVCQSDHDDELRAVAVPSPLFKGDAIDFAQDAVPVWDCCLQCETKEQMKILILSKKTKCDS